MTLRVRFTHTTRHYARFLCACGVESENEFVVWGVGLEHGRPDLPEGWTGNGQGVAIEYTCPKCNQNNQRYSTIS